MNKKAFLDGFACGLSLGVVAMYYVILYRYG